MGAVFIDLMLRSTLLIGLAWAAALLLKRGGASAAMRHLVWLCALVGLLALPLLAASLPRLELPVLSEAAAPIATTATPPAAAVVSPSEAAAPVAAPAVPEPEPALPLWPLYLVVAAALLARLLAGRLALARMWRAAEPADASWTAQLESAAADLRLSAPVALRIAPTPVMPMTWGTGRPRILLPAEARGWSDARRRVVLLHELAHVRRRDSLSQSIGWLACAFYWLHPGAWLAARQMRLEQEVAADDLALGAGTAPRFYAENLLELAGTLALPAPAMARVSELECRLVAIVGTASRRPADASFAAVAGLGILAATWFAATALPVQARSAHDALAPTAQAPVPHRARLASAAQVAEVPATPPVPVTPSATLPAAAVPPAAPVAAAASVATVDFDRQYARDLADNEAERRQALAGEAEAADQERAARARGNTLLAHYLAAQRNAYRDQVATYDQRREVLAQQRWVNAFNAALEARRPADIAEQDEAKRTGQPIPPLEPYQPVPPLPAVPPIPPIPPEAVD